MTRLYEFDVHFAPMEGAWDSNILFQGSRHG